MTDLRASRILLVFAKVPEPGRVKTRIAATLGPERAASLYREMGRAIVDAVRGGDHRTVLYFDPPEGLPAMQEWLGTADLEYLPQPAGTLGHRLAAGFEWGFGEGALVCAIGTDAPGVDRALIGSSFEALAEPDGPEVVFGPATDGGYYLIALRHHRPELFGDIPWSTEVVLARSLERAASLGVRSHLLKVLSDVDHPEDLTPLDLP